jgi:hypothetical protein
MCKKPGCYKTGFEKYGGYCREHAQSQTTTSTVPSKQTTTSVVPKQPTTSLGPPPRTTKSLVSSSSKIAPLTLKGVILLDEDEKGKPLIKKPFKSGGTVPDSRRGFIHRWGCEYLILTADGMIPISNKMLDIMAALVEAMPVATHGGRHNTEKVGDALEALARGLERLGLILFPVPKTLYELLLATMGWTITGTTVTFPAFDTEDAFDLDTGKRGLAGFPKVTGDRCTVQTWTSKEHTEHPEQPAKYYAMLRKAKEHLAFRIYANAWVATQLRGKGGPRVTEGAMIHKFLVAAARALARAKQRGGPIAWANSFSRLAGGCGRTYVPAMILSTMLIELEPCPPGEPGFLLYRGTGKHAESSSLQHGYDMSYGVSLFGGWFFDGPSNGTASACAVQYLLTANGSNRNYWIVKIKWSEFLAAPRLAPLLQHLMTPALPVSVQLLGFGPGFHARLWPRSELPETSVQKFMKSHHLCLEFDSHAWTTIALAVLGMLPDESSSVDLTTLAAAELVDKIERLDAAARRRGWERDPVPGGGDCLYHAVLTHFALEEFGVERGTHTSDVAALRAALAEFIEKTPEALKGPAQGAEIDTAELRQERNDHHRGADSMIYVIQNFIDSKGLHYNLQIYRFTNQLEVFDLGRTTDPDLPIAQWQNYEGGHFDPMLPVLE